MSRGWVWAVVCIESLLSGCLHAPVLWSPDGTWIAYTIAVRSGSPSLPGSWLFETRPPSGSSLVEGRPATSGVAGYRLWATRVDTGESVLLEESRGPLTAPAWSPDGKALAFGRLVSEGAGRARFEVVLQEGPTRQRILLTQSYHKLSAKAVELPGLTLAWSPDGRYLAIPVVHHSLDFAIIRADNGRVLKVVEDASLPAWSPDGAKLAFVRGSDTESLQCIDNSFGPPRHLAEIGQTSQLPVWSRDSQSILVVTRHTAPRRGEGPSPQVDLIRVRFDTGEAEKVVTMTDELGDPERAIHGASFSVDRDGENLFYTIDVEGRPSEIWWYRPRNKEVLRRFPPIDCAVRIGGLAVSPSDRTLALRVGNPGSWAPPGLVDLASEQLTFTAIVPDDSARVEWLVTLLDAARRVLRGALPEATVRGAPVERATLLPIPGELTSNEVIARLRRLGRLGRPLCDRPNNAAPADPALQALLDAARLFFDYLRQDYDAALASLEALDAKTTDPDQRLRLLSVRAQIDLAQGRGDQANDTIDYLGSLRQGPSFRIEETPAGPALTAESDRKQTWPLYLAQRAADYRARAARGNEGADGAPHPFGNLNPDAPAFALPEGGIAIPFAPAAGDFPEPPRLEVGPGIEIRHEVHVVAPRGGRRPRVLSRGRR
jgi:Tol biopolymer transport system component